MKQTLLFSLLALLPVGAWADTYQDPETKVNYEYTVGQSEASVKAGSSSAGSLDATGVIAIIAAFTVDGNEYSVTSIGEYAFRGCSGLTSVNIGNSVTSIGRSAFYYCSGLTSVTIPESVTSIERETFSGCWGLTSVTIPNSVTSIELGAFRGCRGLTSVTIPNSVTSIEDGAFSFCRGLTSITIPESVATIGNSAFEDCSGLTSVTIPNSVTSIVSWAFSGCSGLTEVRSFIVEPFAIYYVFPNASQATLYVPIGTKEKYEATTGWKNFKEIVEMELEGKLKMKFNYNVSEESLVYIFAGTTGESAARGAAANAPSLKIYGIEVKQDAGTPTGIDSLTPNPSPKGEGNVYTLGGQRVDAQSKKKGVYIRGGKKFVR